MKSRYDIDMTLPEWREAITRIQAAVIDYRCLVKDHKLRNFVILGKLAKEFTYISPFYLTDVMARTAKKWERLKTRRIKVHPQLPESIGSISSRSISSEIKEEEIPQITIDDDIMNKQVTDTLLPPLNTMSSKITNRNKSPIGSEIYKEIIKDIVTISMATKKTKSENPIHAPIPNRLLNTSIIRHSPKTIKIGAALEQALEFKLKNCANHIALIQYQSLIEISKFIRISVLPATTVKLVPGITHTFKLILKLVKQQEFTTKIKFHVKYPANSTTPAEPYEYYVPIIRLPDKKFQYRSVTAPEIIVIPPIFSWQLENKSALYEYPFASSYVSVNTNDTHSYYVRIVKRKGDITSGDADETNASNEVNITTPTSVIKYIDDEMKDSSSLSKVFELSSDSLKGGIKSSNVFSRKVKNLTSKKSLINTTTKSNLSIPNEVLELVVTMVERVMDVFVFDKTYLFLKSGESKFIRVYFIQVHHIGCHNCYYDFKFYDSESNELIFTKTARVFADIMPHPIQITPDALDMTDTPITFEQCANSFVITNTHRVYPVNIRIVTSAKMKKLIRIEPMKTVVLGKKSVKFVVNLCTRNGNPLIEKFDEGDLVNEDDLFVLFTVKIVISGYASSYKNITPIYYDIIAPGINEYEYVYRKKYVEKPPFDSD